MVTTVGVGGSLGSVHVWGKKQEKKKISCMEQNKQASFFKLGNRTAGKGARGGGGGAMGVGMNF